MKRNRSPEEINSKCLLLMNLGFDIGSADLSVYMHDVEFDFSATENNAKSIMYEALRQMKIHARKEGVEHLRSDLKSLLDL